MVTLHGALATVPTTTTAAVTTTTTVPTTTTAATATLEAKTTTSPTTTTAAVTTTTVPTTTTTTATITIPTAASASATTTTVPTTTVPTMTTAASTTTDLATTIASSITTPLTTTTWPITASPTTAVAAHTTTATTTAVVTTSARVKTTTEIQLALSTGHQMAVVYLGLILGLSFGISCCCAGTWLAINRYRRRHMKHDAQENDAVVDDDDDDDDDDDECDGEEDDEICHQYDKDDFGDERVADVQNVSDSENDLQELHACDEEIEFGLENESFKRDEVADQVALAATIKFEIQAENREIPKNHIHYDRLHIKLANSLLKLRPRSGPHSVEDQTVSNSSVTTAVEMIEGSLKPLHSANVLRKFHQSNC
ncbi:hypothetical protein ElyMa_001761200 [Elysia marginata]|uniref:Uncharacterized protein n=1 Tax=Elysia marginata TaxID=1093978 RepID=A0AAV4EB07_9GAST|nr:hypothetical protein ElyMa_001761200 [Elysia marginata]